MNKIERLIFIARILDDAGVKSTVSPQDRGVTYEELDAVIDDIENYVEKLNLEHLEKEGLEIIVELAGLKRESKNILN